MNYFWENLSEIFRDRNPVAAFFGALLAFFGVLFLGAVVYRVLAAYGWQDYFGYLLAALALALLVRLVQGIRRMRARARERYKSSPLSRDEIIKARSKLSTNSNFKK